MPLTQGPNSSINLIRAYGEGVLRVNERTYRGAIILSANEVLEEPLVQTVEQLIAIDAARVLALDPELVLLGTGVSQHFPPASFGARFLRMNIGFETMNTGAACRTFNVLVADQRRVVAILLA